jgi:hypothetical protein
MRDGEISQFGNPLLQWLPDESLFSLVSRLHRLWGRPLAGETAKILFGSRIRGTSHDFPSGLDHFAEQTSGLLGRAQDLAESRTLLRYFGPFIDNDLKTNAVAAMRGVLNRASQVSFGFADQSLPSKSSPEGLSNVRGS